MQLSRPVSGHATARSRHRLVEWVMVRRSQGRTLAELLNRVVPKPVLAGFVTLDDRVPRIGRMVEATLLALTATVTALLVNISAEPSERAVRRLPQSNDPQPRRTNSLRG